MICVRKNRVSSFLLLLFTLFTSALNAVEETPFLESEWDFSYDSNEDEEDWECEENCCPTQRIFIDPEFYYLSRTRSGGSHQNGYLGGVKVGYNRIKRNAFYWEVNGEYAEGRLEGKNAFDDALVSDLSDTEIEGRLGYTLQSCEGFRFSFTPYVGYGYFKETNKFLDPSPMTIKFRDLFHYAGVGFLSQIFWTPRLTIGLNFQAKFMIDGKCKVTEDPDPEIDDMVLSIGNKTHYDVEIPITYFVCGECGRWQLGFIPFYRLRQYGGHENFPFDYLRTKIENYGLRFNAAWQF